MEQIETKNLIWFQQLLRTAAQGQEGKHNTNLEERLNSEEISGVIFFLN